MGVGERAGGEGCQPIFCSPEWRVMNMNGNYGRHGKHGKDRWKQESDALSLHHPSVKLRTRIQRLVGSILTGILTPKGACNG